VESVLKNDVNLAMFLTNLVNSLQADTNYQNQAQILPVQSKRASEYWKQHPWTTVSGTYVSLIWGMASSVASGR